MQPDVCYGIPRNHGLDGFIHTPPPWFLLGLLLIEYVLVCLWKRTGLSLPSNERDKGEARYVKTPQKPERVTRTTTAEPTCVSCT